jgi:hypothetical protein
MDSSRKMEEETEETISGSTSNNITGGGATY